jgi:hypothetical protein
MKRTSLFFAVLTASALGLAVFGTGCSSSSTSGGAGGGASTKQTLPGIGEKKSAAITAKSGGKLAATGGELDIPAGALAADTTVTVEIKDPSTFPGADAIAINVYDFGPNGTKFEKPVSLTLDLQGVTAPEGKVAKIAYYDGSSWKTLDDSKLEGGKVTATTTHFTPYTVVWENGKQTQGGCDAFAGFTACGGDVTGKWTFGNACVNLAPIASFSNCKGSSFSGTVDQTGDITFNADGTYAVNVSTDVELAGVYPKACLGQGQTCDQAFTGKDSTVTDDGTNCLPKLSKKDSSQEQGKFTTANGSFTLTKDGGSPSSPIAYCVSGNTLTARNIDKDGNTFFYTATK